MQRSQNNGKSRLAKDAARLLSRLLRDSRGNTLAIVAAALIPITAMIGGGVDMSRAYLAKGRMQQACDSAALAGRRVMVNDTMSSTVRDEARRFFNFNFVQGTYSVAPFTANVSRPTSGTVRVSASSTIPTSVMQVFGFTTIPLAVTCDASQNYINTDVMLVLDTTGSMADNVAGTSKIVSLRSAVMSLYDELAPIQTDLESHGMRLRYGAVPYSQNANVGRLIRAVNPAYIRTNASYYQGTCSYPGLGQIPQEACHDDAVFLQLCRGYGYSTSQCQGLIANRYYDQSRKQFWDMDVSNFVTTSTWNGCIEERSTTNSITPTSGYDIPSAATDLNIELLPNSNSTRWQPAHLPFHNALPSSADACPKESRRLGAMSRSTMQSFVNGLNPVGSTYHDIGMNWGTRLISRAGVFAGDNPQSYAGFPVNRHIIFMTDGIIEPSFSAYSAYGRETEFRRITQSGNNQSDYYGRHEKRFAIMCNEARRQGINIWVVSFATSLTPALTNCASNPGQAVVASNQAELIQRFTQIGQQIGSLRITQ